MKHEFKWILSIEIEVDEDEVGSDSEDRLSDAAEGAMLRAQDRFFDTLNSNDFLKSWRVMEEELK